MSSEPKVCANCHIMRAQYDSWQKSSHHHVAVCNDCHLPRGFVGQYVAKALNGFNHSKAYTLQNFAEPIAIKPFNAPSCRRTAWPAIARWCRTPSMARGPAEEAQLRALPSVRGPRRARRPGRTPYLNPEVVMKSRFHPIARAQRGVSTTSCWRASPWRPSSRPRCAALLVNIFERKQEAKVTTTRLVEVTRDTTDPAKWGVNWPKQYDGYKLTAQLTKTRFGGHGGSEALPQEKIDKDPWLKRMFLGYAFSIDYRDRRGHAYMLQDQENTQRQTKPQTGSCLHCHGSVMPLYRKLGDGDAIKGFEMTYKIPYKDLNKQLHDMGHGHPGELRRLP